MILVTGGTGLVGAHLLFELASNGEFPKAIFRNPDNILATQRLFNALGNPSLFENVQWIEADICDIPKLESAFNGISHVYHCAAMISFDPADEEKMRKTNIEGTANVVNCSLAFGVQKLCFVSSTAAIGDAREGETELSETSEWNPEKPHNDYSISKYGAEMEVWRGRQEGLKVNVLNPGVVLGPGFWETGSGQLFTLVKKGVDYYTEGAMGFVSARDVAKLLYKLMQSEVSGERFIAVAENLSFRQVTEMTADAFRKSRPSKKASQILTAIAWRLDWFFTLFHGKRRLTKDDARTLHAKSRFSNQKIVNEFGFKFEPIGKAIAESVAVQEIILREAHRDRA